MNNEGQDCKQLKEDEQPLTRPIAENAIPPSIAVEAVAALVVDLWKISERAKSEQGMGRVLAACERAEDRLLRMGFEIKNLAGHLYDTNMNVHVVEHEESIGPLTILECLSPAVYYQGGLVRQAEVITKGI